MAWEMVGTYRDFLLAKKDKAAGDKLPQMSIITSGSAGIAIQAMLRQFSLPNLKVLVDIDLPENIVHALEKVQCEVYKTDLSRKPLNWKEILELTDNPQGIDVTSNEALDPLTGYYDWLSYEILNQSPEYCFIPFGTGNLYWNVLKVNKKEVLSVSHDPRFSGEVKCLRRCVFIGATVNDPKSKAYKLYAPHRPFTIFDEQWLKVYLLSGACGAESNVFILQERYLDQALTIAEKNKVNCEPSGIAGLGMLLQMKEQIPRHAKILIVNTGNTKHTI
jgi:hypothetical protein